MSIETFQTDRARAILDKVGWPEWKDGARKHELIWVAYGYLPNPNLPDMPCDTTSGYWKITPFGLPADHIALCLLRNHVHEWLRANHTCLSPNISKDGAVYWCESSGGLKQFFDEDEALLSRAEAVLAKENDEAHTEA